MVISMNREYAAYRKTINGSKEFVRWGAAQRLTFSSAPMMRGTTNNVGGLVPLRYASMYR